MFDFLFPITAKRIKAWERKHQVDNLLKTVETGKSSIRILAIQALGNIGNKKALPTLISLLDSESLNLRTVTEKAVLKIDSSESIKEIIKEKTEYWENIKNEQKETIDNIEIDKDFFGWKGRFKKNMHRTNEIREKLKRPIRWG